MPCIQDNKLVGRAVTAHTRAALAPTLPTVVEAGFPKLVAQPTVAKLLAELGVTPEQMSAAEFTKFVTDQTAVWTPAVRASGAWMN